eukprot:7672370-Pyramimonas_sp.AAC.1
MSALGVQLSREGDTNTSVDHRIGKGEGKFWSNAHIFRGPGTTTSKLRAWSGGPAASVAYGSSTWHLTQNVLTK